MIGAVYLLHGVNKLLRLFGYKDCVVFFDPADDARGNYGS